MADLSINLDKGYSQFLDVLKKEIPQAQVRAHLSVNRELILLYWKIGKMIIERQSAEGWGAKVIQQLSKDLQLEYPKMKGFSTRNLVYMQTFAHAYPDFKFTQQAAAQIPWGHNTTLLDKISDDKERIEVEGDEFFIDMLFYNTSLRCYVVIELKIGKFLPDYAGKLGFYLTLIDRQIKHKDDNPTIGLILCQGAKKVVVEYALHEAYGGCSI